MKKVRFGVLGTAKVGREQVIPALRKSRYCEVAAIASRSMDRAAAVGGALGIARRFGSYEALLAAPDIDAVYIPLPNHLHVDWAIQAMRAGKHVLCEKPLGLDTEDINRLIDATSRYPDIKVMEALMYRHHPQWQDAKRRVDSGEIGQLVTVQSFFSYFNDDPDNIRNQTAAGGGALMDIGCYCVSLSRFLFGTEPTRVCGFMNRDPRFGVDRLFSGMLDFGGGVATFTCATQLARHQRVNILGAAGRIELLAPFNPLPDAPSQIVLQRDDDPDMPVRTVTFGVCDQYALQADQFARAVLEGAPVPTPLTDAWANMHTMEVLLESARLGSWVVC